MFNFTLLILQSLESVLQGIIFSICFCKDTKKRYYSSYFRKKRCVAHGNLKPTIVPADASRINLVYFIFNSYIYLS